MTVEQVDVVVVGAGISGISAAHHLQRDAPDRSYVILEARGAIGGTWDLFRYPGIRSDSDMFTLGFGFRPWTGDKSIADGGSILAYLRDTVEEAGIERHVRFGYRVVSASWSSEDATWMVVARAEGQERRFRCRFLHMCTGYYDYARGYTPEFPGLKDYRGKLVHPQFWPETLDHRGKRIVVIGSGATAVTLIPALVDSGAGHVTMLQRSPSYVVALPSHDRLARALRRMLPARAAYRAIRWRNILFTAASFKWMRSRPAQARKRLLGWVRKHLGPDYDVDRHFTPDYNPWDQRLCVVPDGDLFDVLKDGRASVVTDRIDRFVDDGIRLQSGDALPADIIVTATGLELQLMGDIAISVDGTPVDPSRSMNYKGMMFSDIPNLALSFGYTNASWTLKADLTAAYVARLLNAMRDRGMRQVTPRVAGPLAEAPLLDFTSGYVQRGIDRFPRQGDRTPWRVHQNYLRDLTAMRFGGIDQEMAFSNPEPDPPASRAA